MRNNDTHEIPSQALLEATARVTRDTVDEGNHGLSPRGAQPLAEGREPPAPGCARGTLEVPAEACPGDKTNDGPFDKIKAMIEHIIIRLIGEQKDEDVHKLWYYMVRELITESKEHKAEKVAPYTMKVAERGATTKYLTTQIVENDEKAAPIVEYKRRRPCLATRTTRISWRPSRSLRTPRPPSPTPPR